MPYRWQWEALYSACHGRLQQNVKAFLGFLIGEVCTMVLVWAGHWYTCVNYMYILRVW